MPFSACRRFRSFEVLELDGDVERGGRLVGDQHLGLAADGDGADHALLHAAAHLVRILADALLGRGDLHAAQRGHGLLHDLAERQRPCGGARSPRAAGRRSEKTGLSEVCGSCSTMEMRRPRISRISAGVRSRMFSPPSSTSRLDGAGAALGQQPHQRQRRQALAAARFAHQPQHLAALQREAHAVDRLHHAAAQEEMGVQVADFEDRIAGKGRHSWRSRGSRRSRSQSPNRLTDSTRSVMAMPGIRATHQASAMRPRPSGDHQAPGRGRRRDAGAQEGEASPRR